MTPYYEEDGIQIFHGDALAVMHELPPVTMVCTDPPYNAINRPTGGLRRLDKGEADSLPVDIPQVAVEFMRLAEESIYVWCSGEQFTPWLNEFRTAGWTTRNAAWLKTNPSPMNGEHLWLSALELCVFARKPGAYFARHCQPPVWIGPTEPQSYHPCAKPLWLMNKAIIASCPPGGLVLDPYMGSGTTLIAAKNNGCRAIGIDVNIKHCETAALRINQSCLLFEYEPTADYKGL